MLLKGRPDTDRENPRYVAEMVEVLSWLSPEEHGWLMHPRDGLHTVCKFLPTPADVHEFLRARRAKAQQFETYTTWHKAETQRGPWDEETDYDRKKRVVRDLMGYDPDARQGNARRSFTPPSAEELRSLTLKTPPAPVSPQLTALLQQQGWPFIHKPAASEAA